MTDNNNFACLDDANPICYIKSIIVFAESNIALFQATGSDESVDLLALDVVEFSNGILDLSLVGLDVNNEDQSVAVLNELHGGFSCQGVLDDGMLVQTALSWCALGLVFWLPAVL